MECGLYRAIKVLEHAVKVAERVFEQKIRNLVEIDKMQFGFTAGSGTTALCLRSGSCRRGTGRMGGSCIMRLSIWKKYMIGFRGK